MQKNVAGQKIGIQMVTAADGTAFTGSVTVSVTGDAGTQATGSVGSGACTHEGNGYHTYAPAQAETNYDLIAFTFTGTGAIPSTVQIYTRHDSSVTHWLGTAAATPTVAGVPEVDLTHVAGATTDVSALATNVAAILVDTGTTLDGKLDTIDNFLDTEIAAIITTLGTPAGASVSADIAAIEAQTDDIGAAGAGLTAIPWNASWDPEVQSEVEDALVVHRLDELLNADSDIDGAAPPTVGSVFHELMTKTAGSFTFDQTTDSLEAVRDNMGTAQTGDSFAIVNSGTHGNAALKTLIDAVDNFVDTEVAAIITLIGTPAGASLSADLVVIDDFVDALESRLGTPSDLGSGATVAANLVDIEGFADNIPLIQAVTDKLDDTLEEDAGTGGLYYFNVSAVRRVWDVLLAEHLTAGTTGFALNASGSAGDPWGTALPGAYGAGTAGFIVGMNLDGTVSSRASQTSVNTIDDFLDTEVAAILAAVDTEIAAIITTLGTPAGASISADVLVIDNFVDDLESRLTSTRAGYLDNLSAGAVATAAALDLVDNFVDTEIASIITTLGTPSNLGGGATISFNLSDIEAQTDDIGTAGAGLTALPWNAVWDAEVQSEVDDALVAQNLDHLVKIAVDTDFATTVHLNSVIGHLADNGTSATFDRTTDSLEALQAEDDATQALVAASAIRAAIGLASANLDTQLSTIDDFLDTEVAAILAAVDTEVAAIITTLGTPAGASVSADLLVIDNLVDDLESRLGTPSNLGSGATVAANLADIEGQTDDIGVAGAGLTALATAAELAKVPKSDGTATWNATALASLQQEATDALNAYDPPTNAEMEARTLVAASYATASALDAVDNFVDTEIAAIQTSLAALFTTALTESYRSDGATGTVAQLLYEINQHLGESSIAGTTKTVKKVDGSTTAATFTLNSSTVPTSITRAT